MSGNEKINPVEYFKTLTGFEEIAVERMFGRSAAELAMSAEGGNPFALMRALLFVEAKRAGVSDKEAYRDVMMLQAGDVAEQFGEPDDEPDDEPDAEGKAVTVPAEDLTGMSPMRASWFAPGSPSPSSTSSG